MINITAVLTTNTRHALAVIGLLVPLMFGGPQAAASVILAGDSNNSTFSNCSGCRIGSTSTSLKLSSFTLNIDPISFNTSVNTTALVLAELKLTTQNNPSGTAFFQYNLVLDFTTPSQSATQTFNLAMSASGHGVNSDETLSGLTLSLADPLVLPGVTLANFHFLDTNNGTSGSFSDGTWNVKGHQGKFATLDLVADVTDPPRVVAEPNSLAIILTALAGLALGRRYLPR